MKKFCFEYQQESYVFADTQGLDISLPLKAGENNPNCYYADAPHFETIQSGDFVGSVAQGGACNYQKISLTPHGNGTHTESYGHISDDPDANLQNCLKEFLFFAQLLTIEPLTLPDGDQIIHQKMIETQLGEIRPEAIILRTSPNQPSKKTKKYSGTNPPYLSAEIGTFLADRDIKHLLVDLPSVDREQDEGNLTMHKNFWRYPHNIRRDCTITELIFVDDCILDGYYLLNLQICSLVADASPSKPVLYLLEKIITSKNS